MVTSQLVGKFKRLRGQSSRWQRNAIQLSRNYAFQKLSFWQYFWRFIILPITAALLVMALPWLFFDYNDLLFLGVAVVAGFVSYWLDRIMYLKMINDGIDYFLEDPRRLTWTYPPQPSILDIIHRCGPPLDWGQDS